MLRNPRKGKRKYEQQVRESAHVGFKYGPEFYGHAIKQLRKIMPDFDASQGYRATPGGLRDLDKNERAKLRRWYWKTDHLFSQPTHIIPIRNEQKRLAAQKQSGLHIKSSKRLRVAVYPATNADWKADLKFKADGRILLVEKSPKGKLTWDRVEFDAGRLAQERGDYVREIAERYPPRTLFEPITRGARGAEYGIVKDTADASRIGDNIDDLMDEYEDSWTSWLVGMRPFNFTGTVNASYFRGKSGDARKSSRAERAGFYQQHRRERKREAKQRERRKAWKSSLTRAQMRAKNRAYKAMQRLRERGMI